MVSQRDRQYMQRLGQLKAASHEQAQRSHAALPLAERLLRSWLLYETYRDALQLVERADDPSLFYRRARELGLYRP
jgi:hypothetical protein